MAYPPIWLEEFVHQLACHIFPENFPNPLACHYHQEASCWEVALFPSRVQNQDTTKTSSEASFFSFDVQQAMSAFDDLLHLDWITSPITAQNEVGPHLAMEGIVQGEHLLIRICAQVPKRFQTDPSLMMQA